jgi:hypothetical protein
VIRLLLVIQVPNASDMRVVAVLPCPIDRFLLRLEGGEDVVGMILDHLIVDMAPVKATLGTRLNVNLGHVLRSLTVRSCCE